MPTRTDQAIRDIGLDRRKRQRNLTAAEQPERSHGLAEPAEQTVAVESFLAGKLGFCDIPRVCRAVLDHHAFAPSPSLAELPRLD